MSERPSEHSDKVLEGLGKQPKIIGGMINLTRLKEWWDKRRKKDEKKVEDIGDAASGDPRLERFHYGSKR